MTGAIALPPRPGGRGRGVIINGPGPHDWILRYEVVVLVTAAALPLAVLAVWLLARRRLHAGSTPASAWRRSVAEVGMVYGTAPWVWLTMLPGGRAGQGGAVSLVPLRDLASMPAFQVVGNLLVLGAVGLLAPIRFRALASLPRILALAAAGSTTIETAQYVLRLGRVSSIDDVLLNTVGAGLAALLSRRWWLSRASSPAARRRGRRAVAVRSARRRTETG